MKAKLAVLLVLAALLTGCTQVSLPPVIGNILATNELGLYSVGFQAYVDSDADGTEDSDALLVWDMGDGHRVSGANPTHDYGRTGEFMVTLTATAPHGKSSTKTLEIVVHRNVVGSLFYPGTEFPWWFDYCRTPEDCAL